MSDSSFRFFSSMLRARVANCSEEKPGTSARLGSGCRSIYSDGYLLGRGNDGVTGRGRRITFRCSNTRRDIRGCDCCACGSRRGHLDWCQLPRLVSSSSAAGCRQRAAVTRGGAGTWRACRVTHPERYLGRGSPDAPRVAGGT
jgi:hypothetical protein